MLTIALINPQIPPNTGNIARLCATTGCRLAIVGEPAFSLSEKALRRAGLDYWQDLNWQHHPDVAEYLLSIAKQPMYFLSSKAKRPYTEARFSAQSHLFFGSETCGFPDFIHAEYEESLLRIPMQPGARCLNLSTSVGIVAYEALRQNGFGQLGDCG